MRTIVVTVGIDVVSNYVVSFDVLRRTLEVGKWTVTIRNTAGEWTGDFAVKDEVIIGIQDDDDADAVQILRGYLEVAQPYYGLDHEQFMILSGKCRGAPLDWRWYQKKYVDTQGDDIIDDLFDGVAELPEITFDNSGVESAAIDYEAREGVYYSTHLREIGEMIDFDGYVSDTDTLQFFSVGSVPSNVTLTDTTNILELKYTERDAVNLRNYIKVEGSQVMDGLSDKNANIYTPLGKALVDDTTDKLVGEASLKSTVGPAPCIAAIILDLTTPKYNHSNIDVSKEGNRSIGWFAKHDGGAGFVNQYVLLEDSNEDQIYYDGDTTINVWQNLWSYNEVSIGKNQKIEAAGNDKWVWYGGSTAFNWNLKKVEIGNDDLVEDQHYWIDGICLPINLISIKENDTSQTNYGKRRLYLRRSDIKTQNELEDYAQYVLNKRTNPQALVEVTAKGNTSLNYPGKTVVVTSANEGLSSKTCRIIETRHQYNALTPILDGHDYVTRLLLDPQTSIVSSNRVVDYMQRPLQGEITGTLDMIKALNKEYRRPQS